MIHVEFKKLTSDDCQTIAMITISARKGTPLESDRSIQERAESIEKLAANDAFRILVAIDETDTIVGWTYDYVAFPLMTFISGFFPVVEQTPDSERIALALIEAEKTKIGATGHTRLELELVFPTEAHRDMSKEFVDWYRKCGFQFAAEEANKQSDLSTIELPELDQPEGYILRKFSEVAYDQLEGPGFETFEDSNDDLFRSMSHAEQRVTLKHFFDHSEPYIDDASLVLEKDGKIVGFIVTRNKDGEVSIGPIGLIPEARGQGLADFILVYALKKFREDGITNPVLDMSITNTPARRLYERYGFMDVSYKQFYYWSPDLS
ncbi:MAG: GNAT family N-acetyltransferase [Candidatus Thorarchaeota archaeon]